VRRCRISGPLVFEGDLGYFEMGNGGKNWVKHVKIKHVILFNIKDVDLIMI
jgi:hypothetical protein